MEALNTSIKSKLYANTGLGAEIKIMASANSGTRRAPHPGVDIGPGVPDAAATAEAKDKAQEKAVG